MYSDSISRWRALFKMSIWPLCTTLCVCVFMDVHLRCVQHVIYSHVPTNAQSKQQLVLHADTEFNYKVNNLIENMKYVLYDANIEFNAEKRAHVKCTTNQWECRVSANWLVGSHREKDGSIRSACETREELRHIENWRLKYTHTKRSNSSDNNEWTPEKKKHILWVQKKKFKVFHRVYEIQRLFFNAQFMLLHPTQWISVALIHMRRGELPKSKCTQKAYHMFIASITASVTHSSWLPFLMNLNRAILFYMFCVLVYTRFFSGFRLVFLSIDGANIFHYFGYSVHTFLSWRKRLQYLHCYRSLLLCDNGRNK